MSQSFAPVKLPEPKVLGAQQPEGHELLRLIVFLMADQIRQEFYATWDELNWGQIATHLNENFMLDRSNPGLVRKDRKTPTSDDVFYEIEKGKFRERRIEFLELVGLATKNPLTDKPFSVYEMLAIIRADKRAFPRFDELHGVLKEMFNENELHGVSEVGKLIVATLDLLEKEEEDLIEEMNEFIGIENYFKLETLERLIQEADAPSDWMPPLDFVVTLQSMRLIRSPHTGNVLDKNKLIMTLRGKYDPETDTMYE